VKYSDLSNPKGRRGFTHQDLSVVLRREKGLGVLTRKSNKGKSEHITQLVRKWQM